MATIAAGARERFAATLLVFGEPPGNNRGTQGTCAGEELRREIPILQQAFNPARRAGGKVRPLFVDDDRKRRDAIRAETGGSNETVFNLEDRRRHRLQLARLCGGNPGPPQCHRPALRQVSKRPVVGHRASRPQQRGYGRLLPVGDAHDRMDPMVGIDQGTPHSAQGNGVQSRERAAVERAVPLPPGEVCFEKLFSVALSRRALAAVVGYQRDRHFRGEREQDAWIAFGQADTRGVIEQGPWIMCGRPRKGFRQGLRRSVENRAAPRIKHLRAPIAAANPVLGQGNKQGRRIAGDGTARRGEAQRASPGKGRNGKERNWLHLNPVRRWRRSCAAAREARQAGPCLAHPTMRYWDPGGFP